MGRLPSSGGPAFRFTQTEVAEMETVLQEHHNQMPAREILVSLSDKFSESAERKGRIVVQFKQIWNWFQNRRYAIRAKSSKVTGKLSVSSMPRDDLNPLRNVPQSVSAPLPPPMTAPMYAAMPATTGSGFKVLKASFIFPKFGLLIECFTVRSYSCEISKNIVAHCLAVFLCF
ncbi:Protein SAWADEE [Hibiscus syriacus]|uniref:Protein SAWADEE n=1 Tax=Hibiscus syriacus TaxID=106335 RepID=A0A6A2YBG0_HIBSY|nr:Protein SAWADEE [Hibiscus syriacus]